MNKKYFLYLISFFFISSINAQITTNNTTYTSEQLIGEVLNGGANCVTITNVQSYTGTNVNGIAYFEKNGTNFPFENGIILSTGNAMDAAGPNDEVLNGQEIGWNGDIDVEHVTGHPNTLNASYIAFDFIPTENEISFRFILASEHYNKNNECFNAQPLAFILHNVTSGVVADYNLARLPITNTGNDFVTTDNVHTVLPSLCTSYNEQYFSNYNFDDTDPSVAQNSAIEYGGQTVPITAFAPVNPGDTYHLKLVIADVNSSNLDAAVFIEGGNFNSCPPPVPPTNNGVSLYPSYSNEKVFISANEKIQEVVIINMLGSVVDSVSLNSKDYVLDVKDLQAGIYFVKINMNGYKKVMRIVRK